MVEYTVIGIVFIGLMYFLHKLTFDLSSTYDPIKIFLIIFNMFFGVLGLHMAGVVVSENTGSAALVNAVGVAYSAWLTMSIVFTTFVVLYLIIRIWNNLKAGEKIKLYDGENK